MFLRLGFTPVHLIMHVNKPNKALLEYVTPILFGLNPKKNPRPFYETPHVM